MTSSGLMTLEFPNTSHPFSKAGGASAKALKMKPEAPKTGLNDAAPVRTAKVWRCDVCKERTFEDFKEACAHEERCEKRKKERKAKEEELELEQARLMEQQQQQMQRQQQRQKQQQLEEQERQKQQIKKEEEIEQQQKQKQQEQPMQQMQSPEPVPSRQIDANEVVHNEETEQRKQQMLVPDSVPSRPKHSQEVVQKKKQRQTQDPDSQALQKVLKAAPKREVKKESKSKAKLTATPTNSFFAPRKPGAANSKKRSSDKTANGGANAFFQPRTVKKQKGASSSNSTTPSCSQSTALSQSSVIDLLDDTPPSSAQKATASAEVQFIASKQTKQRKRPLKQDEVTVDNAHCVANALAAMINRQTTTTSPPSSQSSSSSSKNLPLAGIFSKPSKDLIAEQRQAEFQAKRRLERQKELERQQKRQARGLPDVRSKPKTSVVAKTSLPKAPRFPVPSHIMQTPDVLDPVQIRFAEEWKRSAMETEESTSSEVVSQQASSHKKLVSCPSALDCLPDASEEHTIQNALHQVLLPQKSIQDKLLVDQYSTNLVGESIQQTKHELTKWVRAWCDVRQEAWKRMMERQRKLAKRPKVRARKKKSQSDSYDDLWANDDFGLDGELRNLVLLTGASGTGKTALVHQVANECQCPVLEINTTQARGGAALKHAIQEATQSCSSLDMIQRQSRKLMQSPFGDDSDDEGKDGEDGGDSKMSSPLTVILIDEVDFLFDEQGDAGFWNALGSLTKTAKCPIFVTANKTPPQIQQLQQFNRWDLPKPSPDECMTKLLQVCRQEGIPMRPELNRDEIKSRLVHVAELCGCDVRRMLNELQSFCYPVPNLESEKCNLEGDSSFADSSNPQWSASIQLPRMDSLNLCKVSRRKHSIVTIHGKNFNYLQRFKGEWNVLLGDKPCKAHVVEDENLLILCPPLEQASRNFQPISIQLSNGGTIGCNSVETLDLPGGSKLNGRKCIWLQYEDAELSLEGDNDSDEEMEFESSEGGEPKEKSKVSNVASREEIEDDKSVLESWQSITAEQGVDKKAPVVGPNLQSQVDVLSALEMLACNTYDMSDAAVLEGLQHGLPSLSGACQGYGFHLTDGAECEKGKMKMSEQLRPPSEEKLYESGWKDNCYFFGNAETYMVHPSTSLERRLINSEMLCSRGNGYHVAAQAPNESKEEGEDEIDIEDLVTETAHSVSEDNFLPQQTSALVLSLPSLIRKSVGRNFGDCHSFDESVFNTSRRQLLLEANTLTACMTRLQRQRKTYVISPLEPYDMKNVSSVLELLPMLRRVSVLEQDSERIESVASEDRNVRSTRNSSRRGRQHYFEKLGLCEGHGQALTASKAGQSFAQSFLVYDKAEKTTSAS